MTTTYILNITTIHLHLPKDDLLYAVLSAVNGCDGIRCGLKPETQSFEIGTEKAFCIISLSDLSLPVVHNMHIYVL